MFYYIDIVIPKDIGADSDQVDETEEENEVSDSWNDLGIDRMASVDPSKTAKPNDRKKPLPSLPHQQFPQS